jgi:hypothetical protein
MAAVGRLPTFGPAPVIVLPLSTELPDTTGSFRAINSRTFPKTSIGAGALQAPVHYRGINSRRHYDAGPLTRSFTPLFMGMFISAAGSSPASDGFEIAATKPTLEVSNLQRLLQSSSVPCRNARSAIQ